MLFDADANVGRMDSKIHQRSQAWLPMLTILMESPLLKDIEMLVGASDCHWDHQKY